MFRRLPVSSLPLPRLAVAALALAVLAGCGQPPQQKMPPPMAGFIVITAQSIELASELAGRTSPFRVSEVRPQVTGILLRRLFTEGSVVKAGQSLYQIDPAPYQAVYDSAAAALVAAKVKSERYGALQKAGAVAPQDADTALAAYKQAVAAVETAKINLNYTHIVAPITGRISASNVTEGALVTANQANALATISTLDPIYVDISQSSSEVIALERAASAGQIDRNGPITAKVTLKLDDGSAYPLDGKLQFTDVTVDPSTGTVQLRALFPNPDNLLLPGMYVRATVIEGVDPKGILAPQRAVSHNEKGDPTTLVVDDHNIARLRVLTTGRAVGGDWQVLSGLEPGDKVIVDGLQNIRPDMPVTPMQTKIVPAQTGKP